VSAAVLQCSSVRCKRPAYGGGCCWHCLKVILAGIPDWSRCACGEVAIEGDPVLGGPLEFCPKCYKKLKADFEASEKTTK